MIKIKKSFKFAIALLAVAIPFLGARAAFASSTATVAATVTPQNISVSASDGSVAYGTIDLSSSQDTSSGGVDDSQTATNDGNITEDFNITSTHATGGTQWTLAGSIDANQYKHSFCTSDCDGSPTWTALTTSYQALATSKAASGTQVFDLKIDTPSSSSDYVQKSITVTVQAVAS